MATSTLYLGNTDLRGNIGCSVFWGADDERNISARCGQGVIDRDGAELEAFIRLLESLGAQGDCHSLPRALSIKTTRSNVILWLFVLLPSYQRYGWKTSAEDSYPAHYEPMLRYILILLDHARACCGFQPTFLLVPTDSNDEARSLARKGSRREQVDRESWAESICKVKMAALRNLMKETTPSTSLELEKAMLDLLAAQRAARGEDVPAQDTAMESEDHRTEKAVAGNDKRNIPTTSLKGKEKEVVFHRKDGEEEKAVVIQARKETKKAVKEEKETKKRKYEGNAIVDGSSGGTARTEEPSNVKRVRKQPDDKDSTTTKQLDAKQDAVIPSQEVVKKEVVKEETVKEEVDVKLDSKDGQLSDGHRESDMGGLEVRGQISDEERLEEVGRKVAQKIIQVTSPPPTTAAPESPAVSAISTNPPASSLSARSASSNSSNSNAVVTSSSSFQRSPTGPSHPPRYVQFNQRPPVQQQVPYHGNQYYAPQYFNYPHHQFWLQQQSYGGWPR